MFSGMLECVEQNKVLPCEKFEVKGTTAGGALGGPRKARLSVSRKVCWTKLASFLILAVA